MQKLTNIFLYFLKITPVILATFFVCANAQGDTLLLQDIHLVSAGNTREVLKIEGPLNCPKGVFEFSATFKPLNNSQGELLRFSEGTQLNWFWSLYVHTEDLVQKNFSGFRNYVSVVNPNPNNDNKNSVEIYLNNLRYSFYPENCSTSLESKYSESDEQILRIFGQAFVGHTANISYNFKQFKNYTDNSCFAFSLKDAVGNVTELKNGSELLTHVEFPLSVVFEKKCESSRYTTVEDSKKDYSLYFKIKDIE